MPSALGLVYLCSRIFNQYQCDIALRILYLCPRIFDLCSRIFDLCTRIFYPCSIIFDLCSRIFYPCYKQVSHGATLIFDDVFTFVLTRPSKYCVTHKMYVGFWI